MQKDQQKLAQLIQGKKVAFIGAGVSHKTLIKEFVELGAHVTLCDQKKSVEDFGDYAATIRELGIDVGTTKQFWIYISKQKIPLKYQHRINQICSSVRHERIIVPYSDKLLRMLVSKLPQPLGKRLNHTTSVLRIYKYDVDE